MSSNGAEFYPMCAQILIDGNGIGRPNETITLPAAYNGSDGGIIFDVGRIIARFPRPTSDFVSYQAYTPPVPQFTFPGGPVSDLAATEEGMGPAAPQISSSTSDTEDDNAPTTTTSSTMTSPTTAMQSPTRCNGAISLTARCLVKADSIQKHQVKRFGMLGRGLSRRV